MGVLVDSSVWIAADKKNTKEHVLLKQMLTSPSYDIVTCKPICLEVCQGARNSAEFDLLWTGLEGITDLIISDDTWHASAKNFFRCRQKGITVTTLDCLIASLACEHNVSLWSLDKVFKQIAPVLGLDLFSI